MLSFQREKQAIGVIPEVVRGKVEPEAGGGGLPFSGEREGGVPRGAEAPLKRFYLQRQGGVETNDEYPVVVLSCPEAVGKPGIQVGFESLAGATNSAYGAAVSYNIHHATKGEYPDVEIDFPNAVIAKGALYGTDEMTVTREPGSLKMEWDPEASNNSSDTDGLMMIAYNPDW